MFRGGTQICTKSEVGGVPRFAQTKTRNPPGDKGQKKCNTFTERQTVGENATLKQVFDKCVAYVAPKINQIRAMVISNRRK